MAVELLSLDEVGVKSPEEFLAVLRIENRLGQLPLNFLIILGNRGYDLDLP